MYRVEWLDSSLNELASVWMAADSVMRDRIRSAVSTLEDHLRHDPQLLGESREGNERVVFFEPLGGYHRAGYARAYRDRPSHLARSPSMTRRSMLLAGRLFAFKP